MSQHTFLNLGLCKNGQREKSSGQKNSVNPTVSKVYRSSKEKHYIDDASAKTSLSMSSSQPDVANSSASFSSSLEKSRFSSLA